MRVFMRGALNRVGSWIWSSVSALMRFGVASGILKQIKLNARVISVGNIQAGGSGKTPLVALIAREALERRLNTCILTRGYKSEWERLGGVISPASAVPLSSVAGDEACLLHELVPKAFIGVGADRVKAFKSASVVCDSSFDLVILDDGFQHFKIKKDLEIVALTSAKPGSRLFREGAAALRLADLLVWTKGEERPHNIFNKLMIRIKYILNKKSEDNPSPLWLVTGLADGKAMNELLRSRGFIISKHISFADHMKYDHVVVQEILDGAGRAHCRVALSGKDFVKWRELGVRADQVEVFEPELVFDEGRDIWLRVLWGE